MTTLSFAGIIIGVALFMYMAYKGYNIYFNVLIASAIIFLTDGMNPFTGWTTVFMPAFGNVAKTYILIYVLSAIYAAQMAYSGAAKALAVKISRALKRNAKSEIATKFFAVLTMPITCAILTYGGVSSLMLTFIIVALFKEMFKELDIPWEYYCFASVGTATFALGMMPGAPDMINVAPTTILGTTTMAAPGIGILGSVIYLAISCWYLWRCMKKTVASGEGYLPTGSYIEAAEVKKIADGKPEHNLILCLLPPVALLVSLNIIKLNLVTSLVIANLTHAVLFFKWTNFKECISDGATRGIGTACILTSSIAFGSVVSSVSGFETIKAGLGYLSVLPPIWTVFVATNIMAAVTASGTSAVNTTLNMFGENFLAMGLAPEAIHRVCSMTALGLNTLPNSAAMANSTAVTKLPIPIIWKHFRWTTVVFPLVSAFVATLLVSFGLVF